MAGTLAEAGGSSRCVFVVGKGGVGKTTSAGALAVGLAAGGSAVRLLSTDPAHSLGDLFGVPLPPGATAHVCGVLLVAFDASAYAKAWSAGVRPRLAGILEAGTYLDADEVAGFLDLSLPGIDEVMAAFRLADLAAASERLVVDTAPTGHTLRLLEAPDLIDGWLTPLRAMAAKGATVASSLTGTPLRLTGEAALDEMAAAADSFRRLLRSATFLVVERADAAVRAETDRLLARLAARRLHVGAVLHVGAGAVRGGVRALRMPPPQRTTDPCADLAWLAAHADEARAGGEAPPPGVDGPPARTGEARAFLNTLRPRILLFAGKGGVGKSTCAAAAALGLARTRDVLLVSTDPAGSLGDLLGRDMAVEAVARVPRLRVHQVDAAALLEAARDRYRAEVRRIFESVGLGGDAMDRAVLESFWDLAPPGADEVMALIELTEAEAGADVIVVDAAPTGHFLRLLEMPEVAGAWTRALLRILARYRSAVGLDDVTGRVLAFAKSLRRLRTTLADPEQAGVFLVTVDAPLVGEETGRLRNALERMGTHLAACIVNRAADGAGTAAAAPFGVPAFAAPELTSPPRGVAGLDAFLDTWKRIA